MKPYKFLIPVGIAASALAGGAAKAFPVVPPPANLEIQADPQTAAKDSGLVQHYVKNGEEHTLLLKVSGEGLLYAQHQSHSSHSSHTSHGSHSSHSSHSSHTSHRSSS